MKGEKRTMPLLQFWKPPRKKCPNRLGDAHGQGKRR